MYKKKNKSTYATITTSSPKEELLWYGALSPAAQIDAYELRIAIKPKKPDSDKPRNKRIEKKRREIRYR